MMRRRKRYEQLLDSVGTNDEPLAQLLRTARAPAQPDELSGLDAALAAYATSAAGSGTATSAAERLAERPSRFRPASILKGLAAASLVTKIIAGAVAAAAVGGIALATSSVEHNHRPTPRTGSTSSSQGQPSSALPPSPSTSGSHPRTLSSTPSGLSTPGATAAAGSPSSSDSATTLDESLKGLCRAWLSRPPNTGNADNTPAAARLIAAAGGEDQVDAYCTALLAVPATTSPDPTVTATHRTGTPTARPGKPTGSPTKKNGK
jgi:hypothetical protein